MFSHTQEYALRAVVCLAQHGDKPLTTQQLAEHTHVPPSYMSKVLQLLGKDQIIRALRGIGGGYALAIDARELSILRVISAIDPIERICRCPLGLEGHSSLCSLHRRLDNAIGEAEKTFRETTIAQMLEDTAYHTPLCDHTPNDPEQK